MRCRMVHSQRHTQQAMLLVWTETVSHGSKDLSVWISPVFRDVFTRTDFMFPVFLCSIIFLVVFVLD